MGKQIFFDQEEFHKGNVFELPDQVRADNGLIIEVEEWRGRGGNAVVFSSRNALTGDDLAVKFLMNLGRKSRARFEREIQLLKTLRHDHIVSHLGSGTISAIRLKGDGIRDSKQKHVTMPFLIMELADSNLSDAVVWARDSSGHFVYFR